MAFCKYCGRQIAEGEICMCQSVQAAPTPMQLMQQAQQIPIQQMQQAQQIPIQQMQQAQQIPMQQMQQAQYASSMQYNQQLQNITGQTKVMAGSIWKIFINIIKAPGDAGAGYVRTGNLVNAVIFLAIQAIFSGLFALCCVSKINGLIGLGGTFTAAYKFSGATAFFLTILYSVILSVINAVLLLAAAKIAKGNINFQIALSATSVRSVILAPVIIVSCLLFFINPMIGVGAFAAGFVFGNMFMILPMRGIDGLNDNKIIYIALTVMIISLIIFVIFASKVATTYVPSSIKSLMSGDNILEILEGIL